VPSMRVWRAVLIHRVSENVGPALDCRVQREV